jgi:hypothetical protein
MNKNYMVQSGEILQVITPIIYASALDTVICTSIFLHEKKFAHSKSLTDLRNYYTIAFYCLQLQGVPQNISEKVLSFLIFINVLVA